MTERRGTRAAPRRPAPPFTRSRVNEKSRGERGWAAVGVSRSHPLGPGARRAGRWLTPPSPPPQARLLLLLPLMEVSIREGDLCFKREFRALFSGAPGTGKTTALLDIIANRERLVCGEPFAHIIWCVGEESSLDPNLKKRIPNVRVERGLAFLERLESNSLVIFDDLLATVFDHPLVLDLCIRKSTHDRISLILFSQNLYFQSKFSRTINLALTDIICFLYLRDTSCYETLCRQILGKGYKPLFSALRSHLNERPFNYFWFDLNVKTPYHLRFRALSIEKTRGDGAAAAAPDKIIHQLFLTPDGRHTLSLESKPPVLPPTPPPPPKR